jgi:hypothetical protein
MKVGEAHPGQLLYTRGLVPKPYIKNLDPQEVQACRTAGFLPGFLRPAWIDIDNDQTFPRPNEPLITIFYLGPIRLQETVGGLKKFHLFLYDGNKIALEGYDFRHLQPVEESV